MLDIGFAKGLLDILKWVSERLYDTHIKKTDKEKIRKEAERIVNLATTADVDTYIATPRRKVIDYRVGAAAKRSRHAVKRKPDFKKSGKKKMTVARKKR